MTQQTAFAFDASLDQYENGARSLLAAVQAGAADAEYRFKWFHRRFRTASIAAVRAANFQLDDARGVIAAENYHQDWQAVERFVELVRFNTAVKQFELAADAVVGGAIDRLSALHAEEPRLVSARSVRSHQATLLHYVAANGVEDVRQVTPQNAVEVVNLLVAAGADVNAMACMYERQCTTLGLVVSSCHPANAGLQIPLATTLLQHGASMFDPPPDGAGEKPSHVVTALAFGYLETARAMARQCPDCNDVVVAAGLGQETEVARQLPASSAAHRHRALAIAAQHGHAEVVGQLLDAGEDPNRFNPQGFHAHSTPLHQAALAGHLAVVRLLVERGACTNLVDTVYGSTALDWAMHAGQQECAAYLRSLS